MGGGNVERSEQVIWLQIVASSLVPSPLLGEGSGWGVQASGRGKNKRIEAEVPK